MQQLLDDVILMCSTHDEGKVVVAEMFIRTLEIKIYKQMTVNDIASCLDYSNKLLDEYINTYHCSIGEKPMDADNSALTEEI